LDGNPARACILPVSAADGAELTTIEGVEGSVAEAVKQAWRDNSVPQCGFCQAGQVMSACSLLTSNASPSDEDVDSAMSGNLCRCATYDRIRAAIGQASEALNGEAK
jgi:isoquinoline 1-oxidoreductase alpha subunit